MRAYNAHDVEAVVSCYAHDAVIDDGLGNVLMRGHDAIRAEYAAFFEQCPDLHGEVVHHTSLGDWVVDEERITGWQSEPVRAIAASHISGERIDRALLLG